MKKIDARKQTRKVLNKRRKQVITLLQEEMPVMRIVKTCGLSWSAVNAAINRYKTQGEAALMPAVRGRKQGTGRILNEDQETKIRQLIIKKRPWQCQIKKNLLWNRIGVMQLIERQFEIKLSERVIGNYLKRWGFMLHHQNKGAYDRCSKSVKEWLDENYKKIELEADEKKGHIFWMNKTSIKYNDALALGAKKERLSMISMITNQGKISWLIIRGYFNSRKQISLLKALVPNTKMEIILIRENTKFEFSAETLYWIKHNRNNIRIFPGPFSQNDNVCLAKKAEANDNITFEYEEIDQKWLDVGLDPEID